MTSFIINISSGFVNAGLLVVIEILIFNILHSAVRNGIESYYAWRRLRNGGRVSLRNIKILGIEARRDKVSISVAIFTILTMLTLSVIEWGVNGETQDIVMREGFLYGGDVMMSFRNSIEKQDRIVKIGGVLNRSWTGKQWELHSNCSRLMTDAESKLVHFYRRIAVTKPEVEPRVTDGLFAFHMYRSKLHCYGDEVRLVRDDLEYKGSKFLPPGIEVDNSKAWADVPKLKFWTEWKDPYLLQVREGYVSEPEPVLEEKGFSRRYLIRVRSNEDQGFAVWEIHTGKRKGQYLYNLRLFPEKQLSNLEKKGMNKATGLPGYNIVGYNIVSKFQLGHLVVASALLGGPGTEGYINRFAYLFYSNLGMCHEKSVCQYSDNTSSEPLTLLGEKGTSNQVKFQQYPFNGTPIKVTRVELWSIISFSTLLTILLIMTVITRIARKSSRIKVNPTSTEWLGRLILRDEASEYSERKPEPCLEIIKTEGDTEDIKLVNGAEKPPRSSEASWFATWKSIS